MAILLSDLGRRPCLRAFTVKDVPGVRLISDYQRSNLTRDLVAGVVLATMLVPQGMAYAELTGLPAVTGLYTTIAALIAYAAFGPNRQLVLGPDSSLAPVIAAVILPLAAGDMATAVILASVLSLIAGLICIGAGYARLGVVTELLSKPVRIGYLNGIAVIVFISQLPKALGFSVEADSSFETLVRSFEGVLDGNASVPAVLLSGGSILIIVGLRRINPRIPGIVIAVVASLLAAEFFDLAALGVSTVGDIPSGIPDFGIPGFDLSNLPTLIAGAAAIALVSFADTGALSTATALKSGTRVDPNSEIKALGAANLLSGLFQGFPTSASSSRTAVAMTMGARTQMTGIVAAGGVILILAFIPGVLSAMPSATLAAIVVTASFTLFDLPGTRWLWKVRRSEFILSLGAFLGVVLVGVLEGIVIAIVLSLANFIRRAWWPYSTELVRVKGTKGYHDRDRHPEGWTVPGLLIIRYDAPLFFANAPRFGRTLQEMLATADRPVERILVAGYAITDIDTTGAEILADVLDDLDAKGIDFAFAELKGLVKDRLRSYELYDRVGDDSFFPTIGSAVKSHFSGLDEEE